MAARCAPLADELAAGEERTVKISFDNVFPLLCRRFGDPDAQRLEQRGDSLVLLEVEEQVRLAVAGEELAEPVGVARVAGADDAQAGTEG